MQLVIIGFGYSSAAIATALQAEARSLVVTVRSEAKANALRQAGWSVARFDGSTSRQSWPAPCARRAIFWSPHRRTRPEIRC